MVGGEVHHSSYSAVNNIATEIAARFHTDLAIISTKSISLPKGLYETNLSLIEIKKILVKFAKKVVLLADYSKFSEDAMCLSVTMDEIDEIITDAKTPPEKIAQLRKIGKPVKVV